MAKSGRTRALLAALLAACAASRPAPAPAPRVEDATLDEPLAYVPAAGLRWLVEAHPARIFADSTLKTTLSGVLTPERVAAFAQVTGIDLRTLDEVVVAGYDLGTLYVTSLASPDGGRARARFEARLTTGAVVKHPRPALYRITGTRGGEPRALVSVDDRVFAAATGDLTLARIAQAYAERRLKSPTALRGAALSELPARPNDVFAVFYAPGPFMGAWATAAKGLLAEALALDVVVEPRDGATLSATLTAVGDWNSADVESRMNEAWHDLADSPTGRLFGLDRAKNVSSVAHLHQLTWSADLDVPQLMAGLRAATAANVSEMFDDQGAAPTGAPASSDPATGPAP
ncbi:MAG TPA: hypothetical protein VMI54_12630 [Polyangiaceae bacterium]|nr:hypothetical protein [Polyangiaceae bacterium]